MRFILILSGITILAGLLLAWVLQGGLSRRRRRTPGFWKKLFVRQLLLLPVYIFVVVPGVLGYLGASFVRTRGDEASYEGPVLDDKGNWIVQDRLTLRNGTPQTPEGRDAMLRRAVRIEGDVPLRGFFVPCRDATPSAVVILVHGLFRGAMEVEPVAAMFRDLDADVLLLELRNHGGSARTSFTFGRDEVHDVLAGVEYLRRRKGGIGAPLIAFGVSMGAIAVALAAPDIPELAGLVLDAPMTNLLDTAHRQLAGFLHLPRFYESLILWNLELFSGSDFAAIRPVDACRRLPATLPVLCIGAGQDDRVPPHVVREVFAAVPAPAGTKEIWIDANAHHGRVWEDDPAGYRARIAALVARATHRR